MPAKTPRSSPWSGTGVQARAHALALAAGVATPLSRATSPILIGEDMPANSLPPFLGGKRQFLDYDVVKVAR